MFKVEETLPNLEFLGKSRTYNFRNLVYSLLANKYSELRQQGMIGEAFKACRMKMLITKNLKDQVDLNILAEVSQIAFELGNMD